ncbi:unnamed protein product [Trichobilharzia szidati]|nr:unnamed protein product [Trichobilharzia szidati]
MMYDAVLAFLGLIVILNTLLVPMFGIKSKVGCLMCAILVILWTLVICLLCCEKLESECYALIAFAVIEDILTILFILQSRRLIKKVEATLLILSTACCITATILYYVKKDSPLFRSLAGGFLNTATCSTLLLFSNFVK